MKRLLRSRIIVPRRWSCPRCLSTASSAILSSAPKSANLQDDQLLRNIFDSLDVWRSFNNTNSLPTGLFLNKDLTHPGGFKTFSSRTLSRAQQLVDEISRGKRQDTIIRDLDRLSDMLCSVSDLAGFIRTAHPDREFAEKANETYSDVLEYMNGLNQHEKLYELTAQATAQSREEKAVQHGLLHDFEQSGMSLPPDSRDKFVSLSSEAITLEQKFVGNTSPAEPYIEFNIDDLKGLHRSDLRNISNGTKVRLPTSGNISQRALTLAENENTRRTIWEAQNTGRQDQIGILERLLKIRGELASLTRHKTYAEAKLVDKMAKTPGTFKMYEANPDAVMNFLRSLSHANQPFVEAYLQPLREDKLKFEGNAPFQAWDRNFYQSRYERIHKYKHNLYSDPLSPFLSVGTVIQGLSRLFSQLYGIKFVPKETQLGEVWHEDIRRLDVFDDDGQIGTIYCDLFQRPGKELSSPAHYTIRCSRRVDPHEEDEAMTRNGYQLPTIALVCDFGRPQYQASFLSWTEVETLFHEMGHAMHSMTARTDYHNISGTRCPTDFVELPSVLMEHFCQAPSVIPLFARHYHTDVPLPLDHLHRHLAPTQASRAIGTRYQIMLSVLDMTYHNLSSEAVDTTKICHDVFREYSLYPALPPESRVTLQTTFTHLFPYGASYYSYLFDRAIAAKVWKEVFEKDPLSREAGDKYLNEVLKWGGGRDAWDCIAGVLGQDDLKGGGKEAMERVGQWGIERQ